MSKNAIWRHQSRVVEPASVADDAGEHAWPSRLLPLGGQEHRVTCAAVVVAGHGGQEAQPAAAGALPLRRQLRVQGEWVGVDEQMFLLVRYCAWVAGMLHVRAHSCRSLTAILSYFVSGTFSELHLDYCFTCTILEIYIGPERCRNIFNIKVCVFIVSLCDCGILNVTVCNNFPSKLQLYLVWFWILMCNVLIHVVYYCDYTDQTKSCFRRRIWDYRYCCLCVCLLYLITCF